MILKTPLQRAMDALSFSSIQQFRARLNSSLEVSAGQDCKSRTRQIWEVLQLALRRKFSPQEYFLYRFYKRETTYRDMLTYLSNADLRDKIRPTVNDRQWKCVLDNKWLSIGIMAPPECRCRPCMAISTLPVASPQMGRC